MAQTIRHAGVSGRSMIRSQPPSGCRRATDQPIVVAAAPDHELTMHRVISLDTLRGRPLISLPHGTGPRARLDEGCAAGWRSPGAPRARSARPHGR
ncbi:LysR substrate-binding domain-containing protein [Gandjariella thermophila]|uniref:LysR substrate-binding domain-containing protein n=1 Tax=Gandjariella thermophila TaxID=1931992 RepID=A0A4D4J369_9PSEU|nr:LysR substrate-binding domain-containing protein [Gandjariella thermophila]GDY28443.1 hypothetical protein GTS_00760 [Gandjariella thermophila]